MSILVDCDVWLCALNLAALGGWQPRGTTCERENSHRFDAMAYFEPGGRLIAADDAEQISRCLVRALADVPDAAMPLGGRPFGDEHTLNLLRRAARGDEIGKDQVTASRELLSGAPKQEALALASFLLGGEFSIELTSTNRVSRA